MYVGCQLPIARAEKTVRRPHFGGDWIFFTSRTIHVVTLQAAPMLRNVRECAAAAVQDGRMTSEAAESLLMRYRARLACVTYLT